MKEDMSLSNLGTVAFHAAEVPKNVFLALFLHFNSRLLLYLLFSGLFT